MGLDTAIEHRIEYSNDTEHKSLYSWCLQEFSDDGKQIGRDWIPWVWTLDFHAKKIAYHLAFEDDKDEQNIQIEARERIVAELVPEERLATAPRYFMMGSSRVVEDISLTIRKSDTNEHCHCFAMPEYEGGPDFHEHTIPDHLGFDVFLEAEKFDQIVEFIKAGSLGNLAFSIGRVEGLYSDWSPDIITDKIKILSSPEDHNLDVSGELKEKLPRTGRVGKYYLTISSNEKIVKIKNDEEDSRDNPYEEEQDNLSPDSDISKSTYEAEIGKLENKIEQLRLPLWIAVGLLVAIFLSV